MLTTILTLYFDSLRWVYLLLALLAWQAASPAPNSKTDDPKDPFAGSRKIVYEVESREPEGGLGTTNFPPFRTGYYAIRIDILNTKTKKPDDELMNRAASFIREAFPEAAVDSLRPRADTSTRGAEDLEICRAHLDQPSYVLPAPYFEKVEYCIRLIPGQSDQYPTARIFRIQGEVNVLVTKNQASGYREPSEEDSIPYNKALIDSVAATKSRLATVAKQAGWDATDKWFGGDGILIDGFTKRP